MDDQKNIRRDSSHIKSVLISEIRNIMHSYGDLKPATESAFIIEQIVQQQMMELIGQAIQVANLRNSKVIGLEELIFLLRRDKQKLSRLFRYLAIKDKAQTLKSRSVDEPNNSADFLGVNSTNLSDEATNQSKRIKLCYDFVKSIDQTGELLEAFEKDFFDPVKHDRSLRLDEITRVMDMNQYLKYSEARKANFTRKISSEQFKEWLKADDQSTVKLNSMAVEILQYLAFETVAQIIDMALLVKQDVEREEYGPVIRLSSNFVNADHNLKRLETLNTRVEFPERYSISPEDIREAQRRYNQQRGPMFLMSRINETSPKLFCL